jgi:macrolide transport system ATP-binding/permease protein
MTPVEARRQALIKFGGVESTVEAYRERRGFSFGATVLQDLRYAVRQLKKSPGFTAAAVMAIALGVGINVGIFSVLNGVALRLLPVRRAEQVVSVYQIFHGRFTRNVNNETNGFSYSEYLEYRDHNQVFSGLLAYEPFIEATLTGGRTQQLLGAATSCNYFDVLNERPALGRAFVAPDCASSGGNAVVIISDALWRGTFATDPSLVGKRITLNRTAFTVIGIMPKGFNGTDPLPRDFWAPLTMQAALEGGRDRLNDDKLSWLALLGRIQPRVTLEQVRANLSVIAARLDQLHPGRSTSLVIHAATFFDSPEERQFLLPIASVILAAFGLVLLIACANVANLLLARASVRHKEIALRLSIGAGRWRLVQQLLTESLLLSLIGGALGSILAFSCFAYVTRFVISHLPHTASRLAVDVAPDLHVLAYALGLTLITGIAFGLIPAWQSSRLDLNAALKEVGAYSGSGKKGGLLRNVLVGAQIAVSMILLLAAGLLLRGLYHAQTIDPGFEMKNVASMFLNLEIQGYDASRAALFMQRLRERVEGLPGATEFALAECAPLSQDWSGDSFSLPGRTDKIGIEYNHVSPEYFPLLGIPIVRGRSFMPDEVSETSASVIVTESTARRLWPGQDPLAKTLRESSGREYVVIGVSHDAQVSHLGESNSPYIYFPAGKQTNLRVYVLVRYTGNSAEIAKGIRSAVQSLDRDLPVGVIKLEDNLESWRGPSRVVTALAGVLGALALLLASIGVYAMVSYSVSRSIREIGIRMALGADRVAVMKMVVRQALRPILLGGFVGMVGGAAISWVPSSMLFGLSARDPIAFISVPLFLLVMALPATYIPARRAMRVDPMVALRYE